MQFVRMLVWVLILAALLIFTAFNWRPVEVQIWTNLVLETKIPALVIVAFLMGLVPTWLIHRGTKWRLNRRIAHLESAARSPVVARPTDSSAFPADTYPRSEPRADVDRPLP